jgi:TonB-linked SusC/RagA family outer membrane protein
MRVALFGFDGFRTLRWLAGVSAVALCSVQSVAAQGSNGTVTGTVTGEAGQPIVGAQVSLPGTTLGGVTNGTGHYTIVNVPPKDYRLRAQHIGYKLTEFPISVAAGATVTHNFVMQTQVLSLDQVVITGTAGAARQREVGNSIATVDMANVEQPPSDVGQLLQGRTAGMTVTQSSAAAGSGSMIRLRGNVSVAMSNQPLVYVDGVRIRSDGYAKNVPFNGSDLRSTNDVASPMNDIDPNDIERIEVIKGAAAATLYGTEAAAGVIQIFTKSGHAGKPQWSFQTDQGFYHELPFGPDPSSAPPDDTIPQVYRDSFPSRFAGLPNVGVSRSGGTSSYLFIDPWLRNAPEHHYSLSVSGGGDALKYFVSGLTTDDDGVLPLDNERKQIARGNFSFTPVPNLLFDWNTSVTADNIHNTPAGNNAQGLTLNAFRRDRNYASNDRPEAMNALLNWDLTSAINHIVSGGTATWSPTVNLMNKFTFGYDRAQIENRNLRPYGFQPQPLGVLSDAVSTYQTLTLDYAGNYAIDVGRGLRTTVSWGGQGVTTDSRSTSAYDDNFPGPGNPVVGSGGDPLGQESRQRVVNAGGFGQALLGLKDRYFLTLGLRIDGNSAFGKNLGLQEYPKAAFSWVASDEHWWPKAISVMKVRSAWGESGRAPGAFDAVRTWTNASAGGWAGNPAFIPLNVGNPDLGPERTGELEFGFDATALDDRLNTSFTWFNRNITDALFSVRQIPSLGYDNSQLANVGKMQSHGLELTANYTVLRHRDWDWSVGGSIATNASKVKSLGGAPDFSIGTDAWIMQGQPIPVIRSDNTCLTNPDATGSGGKLVVPQFATDPGTQCIYGANLPTHNYGMNTTLDLPHGIVIDARGEYEGGGYMYDGAGNAAVSRSVRWPGCYDTYKKQDLGQLDQITALQLVRCTPSLTRSDYWIYPSDYFKLRDVSLSIPIPAHYIPRASSARLTLSGHNVWKWVNKDFPTLDPETGNNGGYDSRVRSMLEQVPPPALFLMSLHLVF